MGTKAEDGAPRSITATALAKGTASTLLSAVAASMAKASGGGGGMPGGGWSLLLSTVLAGGIACTLLMRACTDRALPFASHRAQAQERASVTPCDTHAAMHAPVGE